MIGQPLASGEENEWINQWEERESFPSSFVCRQYLIV